MRYSIRVKWWWKMHGKLELDLLPQDCWQPRYKDLVAFSRALRLWWLWFQWTADERSWQGTEIPYDLVDKQLFSPYKASKLGDAPRHPFFIGKNLVIFQDTIFIFLHILCIFLGRLYFRFQFSFVLFAAINGWTQHISFGEDALRFSLPRTL
jgi:hypothetical protein